MNDVKKNYVSPEISVVEINATSIICEVAQLAEPLKAVAELLKNKTSMS